MRRLCALLLLIPACAQEDQVFPTSPSTNNNVSTSSSSNNNENSNTVIIVIPPINSPTAPTTPTTPGTPTNPGPGPTNGQTLPPYGQAVVLGIAAQNPTLVQQSCASHYGPSAWRFLDLVVDVLRQQDARWGYVCRDPSCNSVGEDVISYYPSNTLPTTGVQGVYVIDIIESHCLTPRVGWLNQGLLPNARWANRGRP